MKDITIPLNNYHNLGEAIIKQAEEDYKKALKKIKKCYKVIDEVTTFLKSDWAKLLSKKDPLIILDELENELLNELENE